LFLRIQIDVLGLDWLVQVSWTSVHQPRREQKMQPKQSYWRLGTGRSCKWLRTHHANCSGTPHLYRQLHQLLCAGLVCGLQLAPDVVKIEEDRMTDDEEELSEAEEVKKEVQPSSFCFPGVRCGMGLPFVTVFGCRNWRVRADNMGHKGFIRRRQPASRQSHASNNQGHRCCV
jgi:hypothetical protein